MFVCEISFYSYLTIKDLILFSPPFVRTHYIGNFQSMICHPIWFVVFFETSRVLVCVQLLSMVLCAVVDFLHFIYTGYFMIILGEGRRSQIFNSHIGVILYCSLEFSLWASSEGVFFIKEISVPEKSRSLTWVWLLGNIWKTYLVSSSASALGLLMPYLCTLKRKPAPLLWRTLNK